MPEALYVKALDHLGSAGIDLVGDTLKVTLLDLNDYALAVEAASNASPIAITAAAHGLTTGDLVLIGLVGGNLAANGVFVVTVTGPGAFTLDGSAGSGVYTSGGFIVRLSLDEFIAAVPGAARLATATLANKSLSGGVFDADDVAYASVSGDMAEGLVIWKDTGVEGTSPLIYVGVGVTGLPVQPNGGPINVVWSSGANKVFRILPASGLA